METSTINWKTLTKNLGEKFAEKTMQKDKEGAFVFENYEELKANKFFSLLVPTELGGHGLTFTETCDILKTMAKYCASTALAFSMHQHLVAAAVWKYKNKGEGAPMLQKVAEKQLVLVSTGARDWLESNGEMIKTEGGYLFSGKKSFASQSVAGDIAVTSAPYQDKDGKEWVLHFSTPIKTEGVKIADDWDVLGMRATGSQTIVFNKVLIPNTAITLERTRGEFHPVWSLVLTVAMPLIMSAYVGIAERAMEITLEIGKKHHRNAKHLPYLIGKLNNTLLSAQTQWRAMQTLTNNFNFTPNDETTIKILSYKTNIANEAIETVTEAMEAVGGQSFYKKNQLERLFRDVQAARFHPLPQWDQYAFTGAKLLK